MPDRPDRVDFYLDPMCPWAYQASRWIRAVRDRTGLVVRWRFFSLEEVNREPGKKHPWEREWSYGWSQMRVGALLRRRTMDDVDRWYARLGEAFFERGEPTQHPDRHAALLADLGFDPDLVDEALADPSTTEEVRAEHEGLVRDHGGHGVPTLVFPDGQALFGPVVAPAPIGDDALALWELVLGWRDFPHLYELRRPKTADDQAHIGSVFAPYLAARTWRTVQRPAP